MTEVEAFLIFGVLIGGILGGFLIEILWQNKINSLQKEIQWLRNELMWAREESGICLDCGEETQAVRPGQRQCINPFCPGKHHLYMLKK